MIPCILIPICNQFGIHNYKLFYNESPNGFWIVAELVWKSTKKSGMAPQAVEHRINYTKNQRAQLLETNTQFLSRNSGILTAWD